MTWLKINNWPVSIRSMGGKPTRLGSSRRSSDAAPRWSSPGVVRGFPLRTIPLLQIDALFLEALLLGQGHTWDFESDLYSNGKGLAPTTGYAATLSTSNEKFGSRCMLVASGDTIDYATGFDESVTVMFWRYSAADGSIHHALTYDGTTTTVYQDGAVVGGVEGYSWTPATGTLQLIGEDSNGNTDCYYDGLVIVPACAPLAVITAAYDGGTGYDWSALPNIYVEGDSLPDKVLCKGVAKGGGYMNADNVVKLEYNFELLQVAP